MLADRAASDPDMMRGESVLVVRGAVPLVVEGEKAPPVDSDRVLVTLLAELPLSQAVDLTVRLTGARHKAVYARALALRNGPRDQDPA